MSLASCLVPQTGEQVVRCLFFNLMYLWKEHATLALYYYERSKYWTPRWVDPNFTGKKFQSLANTCIEIELVVCLITLVDSYQNVCKLNNHRSTFAYRVNDEIGLIRKLERWTPWQNMFPRGFILRNSPFGRFHCTFRGCSGAIFSHCRQLALVRAKLL